MWAFLRVETLRFLSYYKVTKRKLLFANARHVLAGTVADHQFLFIGLLASGF